jgi:cytochrome c oxidase subunit 2
VKRWLPIPFVATCIFAQQSTVDPAGPQARSIAALGWFFSLLLGVIFVIVVGFTIWPLTRRHRGIDQEPLEQRHKPSRETERKLATMVGIATATTVLILFGLVVMSSSAGKSISGPRTGGDPMVIEVVGNDWWWYIRYMNDDPRRIFVTANEIHIPVGRPVMIRGTSNDVIHSFWVPNLHGKRDLIPSRITTEWIDADRPGRYRGQCAEFCGLQHANMAMWVVVEPPDQFQAWMERQLQPAAAPTDPVKQRGQTAFLNACVHCHAISGTVANAQVAPDLTHLASRLTIAAGTLPNNKGNLAGWIADPQSIKPGTHMPAVPLKTDDMEPLLAYLGSLQ